MNIYWLNPPLYTRAIYPDVAWMNFNTFMPEHNWIEPIIDWEIFLEIEDIITHIEKQNVDILCISTYVWNHVLCHEVAKIIKEKHPEILVIKGGPFQGYHENYFEENPYIDYMCYATGHGELFMKPLLKQIAEKGYVYDKSMIPFFIDKTYKSNIIKTKYEFPEKSSIISNQAYLLNVKAASQKNNKRLISMYETTRGCPYQCVYCEWGGGIATKVSAKSIDVIEKELELLSLIGFEELELLDANFGILSRDVEVAKLIAKMKNTYGVPNKVMLYGLAKSSVEKREKVLDVFYEHALLTDYFIAIQSLNPDVMKNIKRTDISVEDNLRLAEKYSKMYETTPSVEFIMGLPGSTLDDFYEEMNYFQRIGSKNCWEKMRNVFTLLPDSPANEKAYIEKHKIKTAKVGTMENEENIIMQVTNSVINKYKSYAILVVETYSYTKEDWKEMFLMNRMQRLLGYLIKENVLASDFFKYLFKEFSKSDLYKEIDAYLEKIVTSEFKDRDIILIEGLQTIEEKVMEEYVTKNRKLFEQYLHI